MRLDRFVDDVSLLLDSIGASRAQLVGYSLGSVIALQAAARDGRISAVVAGGIALEIVDPEPITPEVDQRAEWFAATGEPARAALIRALRLPRRVDFDAVHVPVLVLNGSDDLAPHSLVARLPTARAALVTGDHVTAMDDPAFAATAVAFLAES